MKFEKFVSIFREKLRLENKFEVKELSKNQLIGLPNGSNLTIDENTLVFFINRYPDTNYEVCLLKGKFGKHTLWVFKRSGEIIDNKKFNDIDEALKWLEQTYIKDAEMQLKKEEGLIK